MNFKEALQALIKGYKIRGEYWDEGKYIHIDIDGELNGPQGTTHAKFWLDNTTGKSWEIYVEPRVKHKITLYRKPWRTVDNRWIENDWWFSKEAAEKNYETNSFGIGYEYYGDWETKEIEL